MTTCLLSMDFLSDYPGSLFHQTVFLIKLPEIKNCMTLLNGDFSYREGRRHMLSVNHPSRWHTLPD
jgi:hypothetical protein